MKAVILAGGKGTRLAPYTTIFPKPLVPLGHRPILEIILRQLAHYGFKEVILSVGYLAELIQAYFQNGTCPSGQIITYVKELKPLGTAGPLGAIPGLDETFLVMNGDVLTTLDYSELITCHRDHGAMLTIAVYERRVQIDLGVIEIGPGNIVTDYLEKPETIHQVSMGIYVYEPEVLHYIEPNTYLDFPDLVHRLLASGELVVGCPVNAYWLDIGRHDDYAKAQEEFQRLERQFLPGT